MLTETRPSERVLRWVRGSILALWAIGLLLGIPVFVNEGSRILGSQPPGAARNQALRDLVAKAVVGLVVVPSLAFGMLGYGVWPRKNFIRGGPPVVSVWKESRRTRSRSTHQDEV